MGRGIFCRHRQIHIDQPQGVPGEEQRRHRESHTANCVEHSVNCRCRCIHYQTCPSNLFDAGGDILFLKFEEDLSVKEAVFVANQKVIDRLVDAVVSGSFRFINSLAQGAAYTFIALINASIWSR